MFLPAPMRTTTSDVCDARASSLPEDGGFSQWILVAPASSDLVPCALPNVATFPPAKGIRQWCAILDLLVEHVSNSIPHYIARIVSTNLFVRHVRFGVLFVPFLKTEF